jgi:outer membrane protein
MRSRKLSAAIEGSNIFRNRPKKNARHAVLALCLVAPAIAQCADVFRTDRSVSPTPASPMFEGSGEDPCREGPISTPLALFEAVGRTLCQSPKTRSAWASVKSAAAVVGQSWGAYLPTLSGQAGYAREGDRTTVGSHPELNSDYTQNTNVETLSLAWVLYDFGGREATLKASKELLAAAQANQNVVLQSAFASAARDYYAAQAANARVQTTRSIETAAKQNMDAAAARYKTGVAPITDQLQAKTAYAQAVFERASAEGGYRAALGTLAVDMSLPPDHPITMPDMSAGAAPDSRFSQGVHDLLDEATQSHPAVQSARATWQAALANVDIARAQRYPKISLDGALSHADQPLNPTIGTLSYPSHTRSESIGVQVVVPLFQGFTQDYKIRQAKAEADQQEQAMRDAIQQVSTAVWGGYQILETDTENLRNTQVIVDSAREAFEAARQRYQSGVGNILELLSSQSTLAGAQLQQIQAQLEWRASRLQFAAALGQVGMSSIK